MRCLKKSEKSSRIGQFWGIPVTPGLYVVSMGKGERLPVITPRLDWSLEATADERDEQILLLEAAQTELDVQRTEVLAASRR